MPDTALMIVTRYPEKGQVKTRLARRIGEEATLQLYQAFLVDLAMHFAEIPCDLYWVHTPPLPDFHAALARLIAPVSLPGASFPQRGDGLSARLLEAFRSIKAKGYTRAVLISSDSPHVSPAIVNQAIQALDSADVVLGPAEDGGYYLIAMRQPHDVFTDIPMSTDAVLRLTIEKAEQQGLRVALLETLFDVDEYPDMLRLARLLEAEPELAPATARCLARIQKELAL